jgi:hypothetical protein
MADPNFIPTSHPIALEFSSFVYFMTALGWMSDPYGFLSLSSRIEQDLAQPGRYRHNSLATMCFAD